MTSPKLLCRINHDLLETRSYEDDQQIIRDREADVNTLGNSIAKNALDISNSTTFLATSLHPVGSIIAWMGASLSGVEVSVLFLIQLLVELLYFFLLMQAPSGWQRCDGSTILRGTLTGSATPNLNSAGLFLRGGAEEAAGSVEEDAVQNHHHMDGGHTHTVEKFAYHSKTFSPGK